MKPVAKSIDAYLADTPEQQRALLRKVRETVRALAPTATESISYGIPTFKYEGRPIIHFGAARNHVALYGAIPNAVPAKDLARYETSKGTIRFPLDKPIPAALVKKIVKARLAEIAARRKK